VRVEWVRAVKYGKILVGKGELTVTNCHRTQIAIGPNRATKILVVAGLLSLLGGCISTPNKLEQCNSVARQINQRSLLGQKIAELRIEVALKFNGARDVEAFKVVAQTYILKTNSSVGEVELLRKSMAALELKDMGLVGFRDRSVANLAKRITILKQIEAELQRVNGVASAVRDGDEGFISMQPLQSIIGKMEDVDVAEKKNVGAFNFYCEIRPKAQ
jgi:hypothetical protein